MATTPERRNRVLTDADLEALTKHMSLQFESIGYDISTPETRSEIHADHGFIRDLRKGTGKVKMAAITMLALSFCALVIKWLTVGAGVALKLGAVIPK